MREQKKDQNRRRNKRVKSATKNKKMIRFRAGPENAVDENGIAWDDEEVTEEDFLAADDRNAINEGVELDVRVEEEIKGCSKPASAQSDTESPEPTSVSEEASSLLAFANELGVKIKDKNRLKAIVEKERRRTCVE